MLVFKWKINKFYFRTLFDDQTKIESSIDINFKFNLFIYSINSTEKKLYPEENDFCVHRKTSRKKLNYFCRECENRSLVSCFFFAWKGNTSESSEKFKRNRKSEQRARARMFVMLYFSNLKSQLTREIIRWSSVNR